MIKKNYFKKRTYKQRIGDAKKRYRTESKIRKYLIKTEKCFIQPIESHITANGIPDLFVKSSGEFWCELKTMKRKVVNKFTPDWRPRQKEWAKNYQKHGGVWILLVEVNGKLYYTDIVQHSYTIDEMFEFKSFTDPDFIDHIFIY